MKKWKRKHKITQFIHPPPQANPCTVLSAQIHMYKHKKEREKKRQPNQFIVSRCCWGSLCWGGEEIGEEATVLRRLRVLGGRRALLKHRYCAPTLLRDTVGTSSVAVARRLQCYCSDSSFDSKICTNTTKNTLCRIRMNLNAILG